MLFLKVGNSTIFITNLTPLKERSKNRYYSRTPNQPLLKLPPINKLGHTKVKLHFNLDMSKEPNHLKYQTSAYFTKLATLVH